MKNYKLTLFLSLLFAPAPYLKDEENDYFLLKNFKMWIISVQKIQFD